MEINRPPTKYLEKCEMLLWEGGRIGFGPKRWWGVWPGGTKGPFEVVSWGIGPWEQDQKDEWWVEAG